MRRVLLSLLVLLAVSIGIFALLRAIPGDPVSASEQAGSIALTKDQVDEIRRELGLDEPLWQQYAIWMRDLLRGDGGDSLARHNSTVSNLRTALPVTLELAIVSAIGGFLIGVPLGVLSATRRNSALDYLARGFSVGGLSIPDFWIGVMVLVYLALWFSWTVPFGYVPIWEDPARNIQQFGIPALILSLRLSASTLRFTRGGMLEVLNEDYVRTARAKGLRERTVVVRHALRNALIPVVTVTSVQMAYLLGGAVVMETLFSLPGIGLLTVTSVTQRDYTQVQTNVMFFAATTISINIVVDMLYAWIDPRIRLA